LLLALAGLSIAFLTRGRHQAGAGGEATLLIVGDQRGGSRALLEAAGELKDVPYHIQWALFPAASPLLEALDAGAIDVGGIGGAPFAFAYASGAKIKAVTAYRPEGEKAGQSSAIVVLQGSPLRRVADLRGKRVATIRGSAGQDLVLKLAEQAHLDPKSIQWVYLANGEAKAALATGQVDAWSTWASYVGIAVIENHDRVLADAREVGVGAGFYAASDKAIADKKGLLADYVERLARARRWARSHPDDYARVLASETGIPLEVARFSASSVLGKAVPIDAALVEEQRRIFVRYKAAGIIPVLPDLNGAYSDAFNPSAIKGEAGL
jgi:sulfonate transport system substrate-binding protein